MTENKNLPAEQIRDLFFDPKVRAAINKVLPRHLNPEKMLQVAVTVVRRNYKLMQCTKQSLLSAVMGASILGLELEPALGQAYLVPYQNKKGFMEAQLIPGYRGYISLANRSGQIESVTATEVFTKDEFEYELGLNPKLRHIPAEGDRGEFKGAYTIFKHRSGESTFEYMDKAKIDKVRERSKAKDSGPWVTDYEEMAKKTVIRHRAKYEPISVEFARARELEERALIGESQLDLLPGPEPIDADPEGEPDKTPLTPVGEFQELVKAKAKEGKDISLLKDFIKAVAEANKTTEETVKTEAVKDWGNFWGMYEQWAAEKKPIEQTKPKSEEKPKGKRGRPAGWRKNPEPEETKPENGEFLNCPDREQRVNKKVCESCDKRKGCPAWE